MSTALAINPTMDMWNNEKKLQEIRKIVCPTPLTDVEFGCLVELGRATQLNPFMREIWAVKYKQGVAASIFIGRDGYRKAAQRQHDYDYHQVNAVYSKDDFKIVNDEIQHSYGFSNRGELVGAYCIVKRKSAAKYTYSMVTMQEYDSNQSLWKTKPETMIKKVAEAQGLRQSFQDILGGTYSDAEMPQEEKNNVRVIHGETQTERLKNVINVETGEVIEQEEIIDDSPVTQEHIDELVELMLDKGFNQERIDKALEWYRVSCLEELTISQANQFVLQLRKIKNVK